MVNSAGRAGLVVGLREEDPLDRDSVEAPAGRLPLGFVGLGVSSRPPGFCMADRVSGISKRIIKEIKKAAAFFLLRISSFRINSESHREKLLG
jgi:hypothetical protein